MKITRSILLLLSLAVTAFAGAREDWDKVLALDAGPGVTPKSAEEAKSISLAHTEKQEKALRAYLAAYPESAQAFEAMLRLSRLLVLRADLRGENAPAEAADLIQQAGKKASSATQRAEFDFASLAQRMRQSRGVRPTSEQRRSLLDAARIFEREHPGDRRLGALLAEVATLFDGDAKTKERLLSDAKRLTKDPEVLAQISDDTKRLGWLGKALPLKFTGMDGARVDLKDWRGKPVALVFFATWSAPSREVFAQMRRAAEATGAGFIGVSLDTEAAALARFLGADRASIAVAWDGKAWESPLVQALGINALPCVWLLDKDGVVRTLDPLDAPEELLRQLRK